MNLPGGPNTPCARALLAGSSSVGSACHLSILDQATHNRMRRREVRVVHQNFQFVQPEIKRSNQCAGTLHCLLHANVTYIKWAPAAKLENSETYWIRKTANI